MSYDKHLFFITYFCFHNEIVETSFGFAVKSEHNRKKKIMICGCGCGCGSVAERSKVSNSGPMVVSSNPALGHQC